MQIILTQDEVKNIVLKHINERFPGLVKDETLKFDFHREGEYDNSIDVLDGMSFDHKTFPLFISIGAKIRKV